MAVSQSASVTGLLAVPEEAPCFHCGLAVPRGTTYCARVDGISRRMCCRGCQAVAEAIVAHGLESYYHHRTALAPRGQEAAPAFLEQLHVYDNPDVQRSFVRVAGPHVREAALILEGITCAACVWLNEQHLSQIAGVFSVDINYSTRRAYVRWDDRKLELSAILRAVSDIGYTAHPFDTARFDEVQRRERKTALWRLFVAGFGMMQVMMYAYPTYIADGDMSADIESLMRWASLLLTAPVVLYSAAPFFSGAWRDLRMLRVGMDVPVALGVAVAFIASAWATLRGSGEVYYDSITMFVFLLLGGRFLEMNARAKASRAAEELLKLMPAFAERMPGFPPVRATERVAVSMLGRGDYVMVKPGESIPADGRIVEGETEVDEALLSGESRPLFKRTGDRLTGGAVNVTSPVVLRVENIGQETVLAGILRLLDRATVDKPALAQVADRVAHWFVGALLVVAALTCLVWLHLDPSRALWVTVSVLVVSCPCALSLATPTALTAATGALARLGVVVTRGHALETLSRATHVVFDKTGTLTLGRMELLAVETIGVISRGDALRAACALERGSEHPIAKAILAAAAVADGEALSTSGVRNVPGSGVEGMVAGRLLRLGTSAFVAQLAGPMPARKPDDECTLVGLGDEHGWLALFSLRDRMRPGGRALVAALTASGRQVVLLSGDRASVAAQLAANVGIGEIVANATPAEKLAYVKALQDKGAVVAMIGDGVNDAPVLAGAAVSIAMGGGTQVAQETSDLILISDRLEHLATAFDAAAKTLTIIRQNLVWSVAYNVVALPLAVTGNVTPWMAGIGMAASSLVVVANALRLAGQDGTGRIESPAGGFHPARLTPRASRR
ncbi:MAG: heavy metal translocating P-type ATPase [Burkholderiales bacterium]